METKHQALAAGLALTLAFGGAQLPTRTNPTRPVGGVGF